MFDTINNFVKANRFAGGGTSYSCQKLKNFEHANACDGLQKLARTTEIPQKNLSGAKPRKTERSRSENWVLTQKMPKLDNIVSGYSRPQISKIHNDIIIEILRLKSLQYQSNSREKESIDVPLQTYDLSRSNVPYTITKTGASIVCVDNRNKNYRRIELKQERRMAVVAEILERNDWRIDFTLTSILTPTLCYRGETVSVPNSLNHITTTSTSSKVGTFAVNEFNTQNQLMKSKIYKKESYVAIPYRRFCRRRSFSVFQQIL